MIKEEINFLFKTQTKLHVNEWMNWSIERIEGIFFVWKNKNKERKKQFKFLEKMIWKKKDLVYVFLNERR